MTSPPVPESAPLTPRTDAATAHLRPNFSCVRVEFAQQLERELSQSASRISELEAELATARRDLTRLRSVEHLAWHLCESSEENAQTGEITVDKDDFDALAAALPESHPTAAIDAAMVPK